MSKIVNPATLPHARTHLLDSTVIDQQYKLFVTLPPDYDESDGNYPVLYVTDANMLLGLLQMIRWLPLPPMIAVGIGYPTNDDSEIFRLRARDFLPTQNRDEEQAVQEITGMAIESGGASHFLSFIQDQIFPFIDANYRTEIDDKSFVGYSYGGTFGTYILFNAPDTFSRYMIGAPTLIYDNRLCFTYEKKYADRSDDLAKKVYLSVGSLDEDTIEHNASCLLEFHAILKSRNYPNLDMKLDVFTDETHMTGIMPFISSGLRYIYA